MKVSSSGVGLSASNRCMVRSLTGLKEALCATAGGAGALAGLTSPVSGSAGNSFAVPEGEFMELLTEPGCSSTRLKRISKPCPSRSSWPRS